MGNLDAGGVPPLLPGAQPPSASPPPLLADSVTPPLDHPSPARQLLAILLSVCLGLFLADGVVSLLDDSLGLCFGIHLLSTLRGVVCLFAILISILVYALMGFTTMIPKRLFLPIILFNPVAELVLIPCAIYCYGRIQQVAWFISLAQVILGLAVLSRIQGGLGFRWPLVPAKLFAPSRFNWRSLALFLLVNLFGVLPAVTAYLVFCASLAVSHFSEGFLALRPSGLVVQARKYARPDGKTIELFPMSHIGEASFYRKLAQSFPTNSIILMEGVSDHRHLLTNGISYKRMAASLGVAEQHKEFNPIRGQMVSGDVDIAQFSTNTLGFLNFVMLLHAKGLTAETALKLMSYSPPPGFEEGLLDDLLRNRNRHVLEEIQAWLPQTEHIIVPWGAAHMPGIAAGVEKSGFHLAGTQEFVAVRFRSEKAAQTSGPADKARKRR